MPAEPPPQPLDYLAPSTKRRWSRRKIVTVSAIGLAVLVVLFYAGMCITYVATNFNER